MSIQLPGKPDEEAAFLVELGRRVRHARQAAGLTRRQLAEHSGLSERYLAQLEAGEGNISVLLMRRVAKVLRTDLERLVAEPSSRAVSL
jgi:XRE family aerobic/anaerobic benzoate catabolism transcriptional regulator